MTTHKTYLIAGATRGIGRGLVANLLNREGSTVIAGVRDSKAETARSLDELPKGKGSRLIIVGIDAESDTSASTAMHTLQSTHYITHLDVVIANAGKANPFASIAALDLNTARDLFNVNTLGPLRLFQAVFPLLKPGARFLVMSSIAGSIQTALALPFGVAAYGISKAAANFIVAKAAQENPELAITALHPGTVETDMSVAVIESLGREAFSDDQGTSLVITVEESVNGMVALLEKPKEEVTGKFLDWRGEVIPW
ncbi:hypothetical protein M409DRAFT_26463 [Zasmidium cellare ATCC 36951]|uniref:NAD(P)-binding protein n=1 Tax=Zasmidium cellare ATCC 36951 TaxID=1080233 RepID=A0A6A6CC42_ZASCE|nr:uncharacterized protein M409DRAFT_26463 [Zasmidium cellare ATCC 36951]KAF2163016.1 hypothetical protein M409DRAFT_26463 [Zasmidium cellare ATCC 36951]